MTQRRFSGTVCINGHIDLSIVIYAMQYVMSTEQVCEYSHTPTHITSAEHKSAIHIPG